MTTRLQRAIRTATHDTSPAGKWNLVVRRPSDAPVSLTMFRGIPVQIDSYTFTDPFGEGQLSFTVPAVSIFEQRGYGDLRWAVKHADVDLVYTGDLPDNYPAGHRKPDNTVIPGFVWQGYITTFGRSTEEGLRVQCKGAMLQLDNWLAKPEYTARPLPYEWAIARQFLAKPALRLMPVRMVWPSWWTQTYLPVAKAPSWMIPAGVTKGQKWSALLTRETGNFDPALTSYIQTMLASMYTARGRFTLTLDENREPVLHHRDFLFAPDDNTITIDPVAPGVKVDLTEDWDQSITDVYAQGTSLAGVSYSGMQVSVDGTTTYYQPAAALRQTYPTDSKNGWFDRDVMPKEVMLQAQQGLAADEAAIVARNHLSRFSDPGQTGTVTLDTDPMLGDTPVSRFLVRAGMPIYLPKVNGTGLMAHIVDSSANFSSGTVTLNVDTKFRDALTVQEVRERGRDALSVPRMLVGGNWAPAVPDMMWPWSYAEGSGYIPSNSVFNALPLFNGMPQFTPFPWESWTVAHPPSDKRWRSCYMGIGPADTNANGNWFTQHSPWGSNMGVPIRMSQAGTVKLLQVAAYDFNGHVLRVPFHISFWYSGAVNVDTIPPIPAEQAARFPPYKAGQRYPFWQNAFETHLPDGTLAGKNDPKSFVTAGYIRGYGNYYEKAGFYPGSDAAGDAPTGLLVDESQGFSWDMTNSGGDSGWDPYSIERNLTNPHAGYIYAMLYCDAQQDQSVYFLGRIYRVEPGAGGKGA